MIKFFALFLVAILFSSISSSHAATFENSEKQLPKNFYAFGKGILEFQEKSAGPCVFAIPNYLVKSVNATNADSILNLDDFIHNFFIVLGNNNDDSFHYLQIGLPSGSGNPSYLLDLKNNTGDTLHGGFYMDYENLAVFLESDVDDKLITDDSYKKYFTPQSTHVTYGTHTYGPGNYNFGAILLKSNNLSWINDDKCVLHLDWSFTVTNQGDTIIQDPTVGVGKLVDVTEKFSPLKQHKFGVDARNVDCKPGFRLILQQSNEYEEKRPACVTPETKQKLIDRGWAKGDVIPTFDYVIKKDTVTYGSQFQIVGGIVDEVIYDENSNSLVVSLSESDGGYLQIVIQTGVLHQHRQLPFTYFVLVDGEEVAFEQLSPILLKIPFEKGAAEIEIIGTTKI